MLCVSWCYFVIIEIRLFLLDFPFPFDKLCGSFVGIDKTIWIHLTTASYDLIMLMVWVIAHVWHFFVSQLNCIQLYMLNYVWWSFTGFHSAYVYQMPFYPLMSICLKIIICINYSLAQTCTIWHISKTCSCFGTKGFLLWQMRSFLRMYIWFTMIFCTHIALYMYG